MKKKGKKRDVRYGWYTMTLRITEPLQQKLQAVQGDRAFADVVRDALEYYVELRRDLDKVASR
jgi:hypothetical protein